MSSPPSASTGSSLYMHLPPVHTSSYIVGAQERMVWNGFFLQVMCNLRDSSDASSHAASGLPMKRPANCLPSTTSAQQSLLMDSIAPARSTTLRTGVHLLPI